MSNAIVYMGGEEEFMGDREVTDVTVADGVTEIGPRAFRGCKGLTSLSFLRDSAVSTIDWQAFASTRIISLLGIEGVSEIVTGAFASCKSLRAIEGLGCEEMGMGCFERCSRLQSIKGWPASMTEIPMCCFLDCTGMTTVDCNLSHVTSIGMAAFAGCTSLLPPSLSHPAADPAAVLTYLKRKSKDERVVARDAVYASVRRARDQEGAPRTDESPTAFAFALAKLPPDMNRLILEFKLGVVVQR
jgi:hypothetical protein